MTEVNQIQQVMNDIQMIRSAIERHHQLNPSTKKSKYAFDANLLLQFISFFIVLALIVEEFSTDHLINRAISYSADFPDLMVVGLGHVAVWLLFLLMLLYFVIWRSAKHAEQTFTDFMAANFQYLQRLSFVGDLAVKLAVVSLVLMSGKAQWLNPLLVLFIGDYFVQGRYFTVPLRISLVLGLVCFAAATVFYYAQVSLLVWPLGVFLCANAISFIFLWHSRMAWSRGVEHRE